MAARPGVPVRQRRVSTELRELRKRAGLTCADVASALGTSISKISRMETGERGLPVDDVAAMLGLYRVPTQRREQLLDAVRTGHEPNWWQIKRANLPPSWRDLIQIESEAATITNFESLVVPGLLQTAEYTRAVLHGTDDKLSDVEVDGLVATRTARHALLSRHGAPTFHAIIDEAVLRRQVGEPGIMRRQLQYLLTVTQRSNVTVQVLPFTAGATPGLNGPTVVYDLPDGGSVVYVETRVASGLISEAVVVDRARLAMRRLRTVALAPEDTVELITTAAGELPQ